ncbi:hypothetical protein BV25DRAFT_783400 [Artomyces pyxidatus]|uniref:Uncharacterized protein n=1 Tax=Artomyces pyxidatus TaxID=48021 RepID=A0ACB8SYY0_9AGAM|nr:hypothetical protein BV25DRAFT_783400 [Artomyces pyxidatus]
MSSVSTLRNAPAVEVVVRSEVTETSGDGEVTPRTSCFVSADASTMSSLERERNLRAEPIFSQPNVPICYKTNDAVPPVVVVTPTDDGPLSTKPGPSVQTPPPPPIKYSYAYPTHMKLVRLLLFLPWCIFVGACIAMHPQAVRQAVFGTGYAPAPRTPLHRLAYYAHCAVPHVGIFAGLLVFTAAWDIRLGAPAIALATARSASVWWGMELDRQDKEDKEEWEEDARMVWAVVSGKEEVIATRMLVDKAKAE